MALENILQTLETEAERQIVEIEQTTQAEVERIRVQAGADAEAARRKRLAAIQAPLQAEQARLLNRAKQTALQRVLGAREDVMMTVLEATARRLADLAGSEAYPALLRRLLQEAVETLGRQEHLHLRVQGRDAALLRRIVADMELPATIEVQEEGQAAETVALGGLMATTADGRISLDNTLETRLQRVAALYRSQIAAMMFDSPPEA